MAASIDDTKGGPGSAPDPMVVQGEVEIAAAPGRVFDFLADPANWFAIDPSLVEVTPRGTISVGTTGIMRNRRGPGLTAKASWTTTELEPGRQLTQQLTGFGYELTESVTLAATRDGTRMTVTDTLVPTSLAGRIMVALARGIMERDLKARAGRLRTLMEADARSS